MQEYLFLFRGGEVDSLQQTPELWQQHMHRWMQWMGELQKKGQFIGAQPLGPSGKTVSGTAKTITDGPFAEGKEIVAGYLICKAESFEEALSIAKGCPILEFDNGHVEVREIHEMKMS
jgi:hypothetical protein